MPRRKTEELNAYVYAQNNPPTLTDPFGLESGNLNQLVPGPNGEVATNAPAQWSLWARSRWSCTVRCREVTIPLLVPITGFTWGQLMSRVDPETFTWAKPIGYACTNYNAAATVTSTAGASAWIRSSWLRVRSSSP